MFNRNDHLDMHSKCNSCGDTRVFARTYVLRWKFYWIAARLAMMSGLKSGYWAAIKMAQKSGMLSLMSGQSWDGKPFKMAWECKTNGWWPTLVLVNVVLWYCWICPFKKRWRDKKDMVEDYLEGWGVPRETHILSYFKP